jgi:hypothetical protein
MYAVTPWKHVYAFVHIVANGINASAAFMTPLLAAGEL